MPNTVEYNNRFFVKVQPHWQDLKVYGNRVEYRICHVSYDIWLPPGSWQIIGKAESLTDTDWEEIVEKDGNFYRLYNIRYWSDGSTSSPTLSGHSLLKSLNLKPETTIVLKKQTKLK